MFESSQAKMQQRSHNAPYCSGGLACLHLDV
jgi:hypothetical protein